MVKNWILLGDEAFDSIHKPIGVINLAPEELKNWQEIAWGRFADTTNANEKVKNMVFNSNYLYVGALFSKRSGVTNEDVDEFADYIYQNIADIEYVNVDFTSSPATDDGTIILAFGNYDESMASRLQPSKYIYVCGDMVVPVNLQNCSVFS